ncbi:hypothetical protein GIB67_012811 [Kingdonia uniflora]|uniref:C-CAP/cofactor C-like domain-containing protein n=1 Tax=Kingdonia uniflora TaxID=39325 RepID=A0A7J7NFW4_9MAGN|nr:hypothetical protein GIB67_012811 [Kingdonia uniflora]
MEEEQYQTKQTPITNETLDSITQSKHEAMLSRLSNLHQSRLLQQSLTRNSSDSNSSFESTKSFLTNFSESKTSIESQLHLCRNPDSSKPTLKSDLNNISTSITDLERFVAENSYFLPSYEVRASLKTISDLKETLEIANSELLPKKKFSFKNKSVVKKEMSNAEPVVRVCDSVVAEKHSVQVRDSLGFRNEEGVVLVKHFGGAKEGDFTLSDLNGCEVRITGCFRALYIHRLKDCRVFVGPVLGSILIEEVEGCLFVLASHQIRIHHAKGTDFYLRVRSRPIVEDCNGVRFAPYVLDYEGIERDLKESSLDEETGNWENVDDFKWLRAVQSPNWSILPEEERVSGVNISSSEALSIDC